MPSWAIYGNERRRGIHIVPEGVNLLLNPSAFNEAGNWTLYGATISANTDGTGDTLIEGSGGDFHQVSQNVTKAAAAVTYNLSVRAKLVASAPSDSRNRLLLGLQNGTPTAGRSAIVDVQNGQILGVAPSGFGAGFSGGTVAVTSVGSGWYLCEFNGVETDSDTTVKVVFGLDAGVTTDVSSTNYSGDGASGMIIDQAILVVA
jgi:hypothetical protein